MEHFNVVCSCCGSADVSLAVKDVSRNGKNIEIALYCNECENEEYIAEKNKTKLFDKIPLVETTELVYDLGEI